MGDEGGSGGDEDVHPGGGGGGTFVYDDGPAPEPTSLALLGAGVAGLVVRRGRRRCRRG